MSLTHPDDSMSTLAEDAVISESELLEQRIAYFEMEARDLHRLSLDPANAKVFEANRGLIASTIAKLQSIDDAARREIQNGNVLKFVSSNRPAR